MTQGRNIEVRILGDSYQLEAALGKASKSLAQFGGDATAAADAQIKAGVRSREDLQKLAAAYQEAASAAAKGSDEQIIAARKAAEANAQLARLNQEYAAKSVAAADEQSKAWKGASSGMLSFAKQAAFFSAAYLGFEGLKSSIDTVLSAQTSIAQLDRAIVNAHASVSALDPVLEKFAVTSRKLGFADDQTRQAEAELITAFGATKKALGELSVARDLARAKNEDLATATQQLILLQEGNTRAAKQFGLALPDQAKAVWEAKAAQDGLTVSQEKGKVLYDELLPRIHDQAKAFAETPTGKMQEFHAEIQALEESIGGALLPTVTKYLTAVDDWLAKSSNEKRVTHDVEDAIHTLAGVLHDVATLTKDVDAKVGPLVEDFGGWKRVIELLIALKFASVLGGWYTNIQKLIGSGGTGLVGAEGSSAGLLKNLGALRALGEIGVAVIVSYEIATNAQRFSRWLGGTAFGRAVGAGDTPLPPGVSFDQVLKAVNDTKAGHPTAADKKILNALAQLQGKPAPFPGSGTDGGGGEGQRIVRAGKSYGGTGGGTYQSGGGHTSGQVKVGSALDCSGFVYQSLLAAGIKGFSYGNALSQYQQLKRGRGGNWAAVEVGLNDAQPGDIVYWDNRTNEPQPGHCGIVVSGSGAGAKAMQYEDPKDGSGIGPINELPIMGIFRVKIVKGGTSGGGGSPYTPTPPPAVTGSKLISEGLRNLIANAANHATTAQGAGVARWLGKELDALEEARRDLEQKLQGSTGTQRAAIEDELRTVDGQIARVQKSISTAISTWARSQLSAIESKADSAFSRATQAHIQNVLAPRFFQGVDKNGNRRMTPAEALLAAMQAQDQQQQLTGALTSAQAQLAKDKASGADAATLAADQQAVDAAQRQITENNLAAQATKERAKADADYAKAVRKYEAERANREKALNAALLKFTENLGKGAAQIGDLSAVLEHYGLPGNTVHLGGGGHTHAHRRIPVHHGHHHGHHHHYAEGTAPQPRLGGKGADGGGATFILEIDGRRLASALAPYSDQTVRVKLK